VTGRTQNYESGGQEFESLRARHIFKDLAERRRPNREIGLRFGLWKRKIFGRHPRHHPREVEWPATGPALLVGDNTNLAVSRSRLRSQVEQVVDAEFISAILDGKSLRTFPGVALATVHRAVVATLELCELATGPFVRRNRRTMITALPQKRRNISRSVDDWRK